MSAGIEIKIGLYIEALTGKIVDDTSVSVGLGFDAK